MADAGREGRDLRLTTHCRGVARGYKGRGKGCEFLARDGKAVKGGIRTEYDLNL